MPCADFKRTLTMKNIFAIVLASFAITAAAQGADSAEVLQMKELSGLMENSYMEIKWVDSEHFTYTLEENGGRSYYIVDSKSWKPQRMFDNKAFADSLNKISQGGQSP